MGGGGVGGLVLEAFYDCSPKNSTGKILPLNDVYVIMQICFHGTFSSG